jgi:hypothetical protein
MKVPTEFQEGVIVFQWAQFNPIAKKYLFAIPNGGSRDPREAKNLKRQGVRKGVSDFFLPYPSKGKYGLWLELKRRKNARATKEQVDWLREMAELGYEAKLVYGADEAIKAIEEYLRIGQNSSRETS